MVVLLFEMVGCGEKTPYEKARDKTVTVLTQLLNYEITEEEAYKQVNAIQVPKYETSTESLFDVKLKLVKYELSKAKNGSGWDYDGLKKEIDEFKELKFK
jgi:hypothetical protein